ncbi:DUF4192 domain-containing protein [Micromonospora sp. NPDC050417]|uniref:DUF4192 domain-containing protein n=1 Tax=Micromonospora sp. NPDC050417 TaxID=3364280 RepID=UPI00379C618C
MTSTDPPRLTVRSTADLISAVPYLLGFHPADSLVLLAMRDTRIVFVARGDLPEPGDPAALRQAAEYLTAVIRRQGAQAVTILGYGPADRVTPAVDQLEAVTQLAGLMVFDALRVTDGRYWSYRCDEPGCCPPEGTPFDPATSVVAAAATFAGHVALPDRAALTGQVAPVGGTERMAMGLATSRARERLADLLATAAPGDPTGLRSIRAAGTDAVRRAEGRHRARQPLRDDEVAWLCVLLTHLDVRDHAWERIGADDWQVALWTDVLRRAEPGLAAAPGGLLAFAAWRVGNGALAAVAVERALADDPGYSMAQLMADVLNGGLSPSALAESWAGPKSPSRTWRRGGSLRRRPDPGGPSARVARQRRPRRSRRYWRPARRDVG